MEAIIQKVRVRKHFGIRMFKYYKPGFGFSILWHPYSTKYQPTISFDFYKWGFKFLWDFYVDGDGGKELF